MRILDCHWKNTKAQHTFPICPFSFFFLFHFLLPLLCSHNPQRRGIWGEEGNTLYSATHRQFLQAPARARFGLSAAIAAAAAAAVVVAMIRREKGKGERRKYGGGRPHSLYARQPGAVESPSKQPTTERSSMAGAAGLPARARRRNRVQLNGSRVCWSCGSFERFLA